ncbi:flavin reductase family protein [Novosphingobium aquimarinum]|uniref:flavin reductase family protein n=1 Tax=Novosphingobium aquimarinum TaxID=2682494 RepID=UPI001E3842D1|nr:flavin reductase family protein [Novosphingobium aquimarinum]
MAHFDFSKTQTQDRYKLMAAAITPRPIAWVTSVSAAGVRNAAPYSFFNMMSADPPLVALGMMRNPDGTHKDSAANILETKEFVVNLVTKADAAAMNFTSVDAPPDYDELAEAGIAVEASLTVAPPRIATAPVAMECRLFEAVEARASTVVIGEVLTFHVAEAFVDTERLHLDTLGMDLVARMHGAGCYAQSTDLFQMERPQYSSLSSDPDPSG